MAAGAVATQRSAIVDLYIQVPCKAASIAFFERPRVGGRVAVDRAFGPQQAQQCPFMTADVLDVGRSKPFCRPEAELVTTRLELDAP